MVVANLKSTCEVVSAILHKALRFVRHLKARAVVVDFSLIQKLPTKHGIVRDMADSGQIASPETVILRVRGVLFEKAFRSTPPRGRRRAYINNVHTTGLKRSKNPCYWNRRSGGRFPLPQTPFKTATVVAGF